MVTSPYEGKIIKWDVKPQTYVQKIAIYRNVLEFEFKRKNLRLIVTFSAKNVQYIVFYSKCLVETTMLLAIKRNYMYID